MPLENDIQELTKAIRELIDLARKDLAGPAVTTTPKARPAKKTAEPEVLKEAEVIGVSYDDVKKAVLEVAKAKGRDAALDLLEPFGVVKGEGKDRGGSITTLKEEHWEAVVEAATALLA